MKYTTLILAWFCLAIVNTANADQTPALSSPEFQEAYAALPAPWPERRVALLALYGVYGDLINAKLIAEEPLNNAEGNIWFVGYSEANGALVTDQYRLANANLFPPHQIRDSYYRMYRQVSETSDAEVLSGWGSRGFTKDQAAAIYYVRQWEDAENAEDFANEIYAAFSLTPGTGGTWWQKFMRGYIANLQVAEAIVEVERQIRIALGDTPSESRDNWIKEMRAQHVILKGLQE